MTRLAAAAIAASLLVGAIEPAACARAQAAAPFEAVPVDAPVHGSHRLAYASLLAGGGLVGLSFALTDRANRTYDQYLVATDPVEVTRLYDRTVHFDRLSATSLLVGEALVATGVYLRFLRRPAASRLDVALAPDRCALTLRF